jgi:hypothetical protein
MRRKGLNASARRAGLRVTAVTGVHRVTRYVVRRLYLDIHRFVAECRYCGWRWTVEVPDGKRPKTGWRKCPMGCNAGRLARG